MKINEILFSPKTFFSHIHKEKSIRSSFIFLVFCYGFFLILSGIIFLLFFRERISTIFSNFAFSFTPLSYFFFFVLVYGFGLLSSFVSGFFLKIWLHVFKGRDSFVQAYQLNVYSQTPYYLFGWIPVIGGFSFLYSLILLIIGTKIMYKFSTLKATLIYVIPLFVVFLLAFLILFLVFFTLLSNGIPSF